MLIPAFAIGRSQELALILQAMIRNGRLKPFTIYMGGLAQVACNIYEENGVRILGHEIRKMPQGFMETLDDFNGVIIASSGMLLDNSVSAQYAENLLPDQRNAIFLVVTWTRKVQGEGWNDCINIADNASELIKERCLFMQT